MFSFFVKSQMVSGNCRYYSTGGYEWQPFPVPPGQLKPAFHNNPRRGGRLRRKRKFCFFWTAAQSSGPKTPGKRGTFGNVTAKTGKILTASPHFLLLFFCQSSIMCMIKEGFWGLKCSSQVQTSPCCFLQICR